MSLRHEALVALLLLAMQAESEEPGLSKGPANPADIGSRCAAVAGRLDRAYLDCGKQAPQSSTLRGAAPPEPPGSDRLGTGRDGPARRYPLRRR